MLRLQLFNTDYNIFVLELQLISTKSMIKNKLKELLSELKKFKVQTILVLNYKERNDCKIFYLRAKLSHEKNKKLCL